MADNLRPWTIGKERCIRTREPICPRLRGRALLTATRKRNHFDLILLLDYRLTMHESEPRRRELLFPTRRKSNGNVVLSDERKSYRGSAWLPLPQTIPRSFENTQVSLARNESMSQVLLCFLIITLLPSSTFLPDPIVWFDLTAIRSAIASARNIRNRKTSITIYQMGSSTKFTYYWCAFINKQ